MNVLAPATSFYRWQGRDEQAREVPVMIKTSADRYASLEAAIRELHPYELPEILALPATAGLSDYMWWVERECQSAEPEKPPR